MNFFGELLSSSLMERLGWTLVHSVWQLGALACLFGLFMTALRRRSATVRYVVACVTLGTMVALPARNRQTDGKK